jgi:hypothetical protein
VVSALVQMRDPGGKTRFALDRPYFCVLERP